MSVSQLSQLAAVARVTFVLDDAGFVPAFIVQRGFREVRSPQVAPAPLTGFCQLLFDASFGLPAPTEVVVVISPESQIVDQAYNSAVDWQWYFDPDLEEWTLLVVTSNCNGAAPRRFNVVAHRVN